MKTVGEIKEQLAQRTASEAIEAVCDLLRDSPLRFAPEAAFTREAVSALIDRAGPYLALLASTVPQLPEGKCASANDQDHAA